MFQTSYLCILIMYINLNIAHKTPWEYIYTQGVFLNILTNVSIYNNYIPTVSSSTPIVWAIKDKDINVENTYPI